MYEPKIRTAARNSYNQVRDHDRTDMEQELRVVLWRCVNDYNPDRGGSFSTFFWQSARNRISTLIRFYSTQSRKAETVSLDVEAVRMAVDDLLEQPSAEDTAIMQIEIRGYVTTYGDEVFDGESLASG